MHFNENVPYKDDITPEQYKAKNKELGAEVKKCYEIRKETMKNQVEAMIEQEKSWIRTLIKFKKEFSVVNSFRFIAIKRTRNIYTTWLWKFKIVEVVPNIFSDL